MYSQTMTRPTARAPVMRLCRRSAFAGRSSSGARKEVMSLAVVRMTEASRSVAMVLG